MSNTQTKHATSGRPLSTTGALTKQAVRSYVEQHGKEGFTIAEIAASAQLGLDDVKNHVNMLVRRGELVRIPNAQRSGVGRPKTLFKLAEAETVAEAAPAQDQQ